MFHLEQSTHLCYRPSRRFVRDPAKVPNHRRKGPVARCATDFPPQSRHHTQFHMRGFLGFGLLHIRTLPRRAKFVSTAMHFDLAGVALTA